MSERRKIDRRRLALMFWVGWLTTHAAMTSAGVPEARAYAAEAERKLAMGDVARAEILYAQAMQEAPNDVAFAMSLAELYITQQRFESAKSLIDAALQAHQQDYRAWKTQAVYLRAKGDESQALQAFERAFSLGAKEDRYVLVNLQRHFEATGNTARKRQMDNLIQALDMREPH